MSWLTSWLPGFGGDVEQSVGQSVGTETKQEIPIDCVKEQFNEQQPQPQETASQELPIPSLQRESYVLTEPKQVSFDELPPLICPTDDSTDASNLLPVIETQKVLVEVEPIEPSTETPAELPKEEVEFKTTISYFTPTPQVIEEGEPVGFQTHNSALMKSVMELKDSPVCKQLIPWTENKGTQTIETKPETEMLTLERRQIELLSEQRKADAKIIERLTKNLDHSRLLYQQLNEKFVKKTAKSDGIRSCLEKEILELRIENQTLRRHVPLSNQPIEAKRDRKKNKKQMKQESKRLREGQSDRFREQDF